MKRITLFSLAALTSIVGMAQSKLDSSSTQPKVQVTFIYPIGTSGVHTIQEEHEVSINIFAGATAGIRGVEVGSFANYTRGSVDGVQVSGYVNVVRDSVEGVQVAGFTNVVLDKAEGVQAAGFANVVIDDFRGVQASGYGNYVGGEMNGAQVSGFGNAVMGEMKGIQIAGFGNYAHGIKGHQIAGFANANLDHMKGNQISGYANIATGTIEGVQISGFINVAQKIKGAQLGFINYADSIEGIAIGFLSYAKNGYHVFELSSNETFETNLTYKTGTNRFYNAFTAGIHWNQNKTVWALGYGIGTRKLMGNGFSVNADLKTYAVLREDYSNVNWESFNKLELSMAKSFKSKFEIYAGGSLNMWLSDQEKAEQDYLRWTGNKGKTNDVNWILYPGFQVGIRL